MPAPYNGLDTINATYGNTTDLTRILVYANDITDGFMGPMILFAFFMVALMGSYYAQIRFSSRGKIESSFTAAGFVTTGLAVIMSTVIGLLSLQWVLYSLVITILGVLWIYLSPPEQY